MARLLENFFPQFTFQEIRINFLNAFRLTVAFLLELMALAAFACLGVIISGSALVRYGVAAITIGTVIALWALFAAPRSQRRLAAPWLYYFKMLFFGAAAAVLLMAHWAYLATSFVLIATLNLALEAKQSNGN